MDAGGGGSHPTTGATVEASSAAGATLARGEGRKVYRAIVPPKSYITTRHYADDARAQMCSASNTGVNLLLANAKHTTAGTATTTAK